MRPRHVARISWASLLATGLIGCGSEPASTGPGAVARPELPADADPVANKALAEGITQIVNEMTIRYSPLDYEYDEDLLEKFDQVEAYLAAGAQGEPPRFMERLDADEEVDHLSEAIRRWEAASGKALRPEIDPLKAEVAARDPDGERFHPEFHKRFAVIFDDLIKHEATHILELRNQAIRAKAADLFDTHRTAHPELVRYYEGMVEAQYPSPDLGGAEPASAGAGSAS